MEEVEALKLVIAILSLLLSISEIFFPFLTPYQGFLDAIKTILTKKVKEEEEATVEPVEKKRVVIDESKNESKPHLPASWTTTESDKSE
jgi:hypothetical protein